MYTITGGQKLFGEIQIKGAKNAALPIMAASLLADDEIIIHNCPDITDVCDMKSVLECAGCNTEFRKNTVFIDPCFASNADILCENSCKIRSSVFMIGPLVSRFRKATIFRPGGCAIGKRPIDIHISGLEKLGVTIKEESDRIICRADNLKGAKVYLKYPSVGATANIIMAAVKAKGKTVINNAAKEPEIKELCRFLNILGAKISGEGSCRIVVEGVEKLSGGEIRLMSDRIAAATYIAACGAAKGDIFLRGAAATNMQDVINVVHNMGMVLKYDKYGIRAVCNKRLNNNGVNISTGPYPMFSTDAQPLMGALMCLSKGEGVIEENVFENRFLYLNELKKMGADIHINGNKALIKGVSRLKGIETKAMDLRGGAALLIAALAAKGKTVIKNSGIIERGYENISGDLEKVGANIYKS